MDYGEHLCWFPHAVFLRHKVSDILFRQTHITMKIQEVGLGFGFYLRTLSYPSILQAYPRRSTGLLKVRLWETEASINDSETSRIIIGEEKWAHIFCL